MQHNTSVIILNSVDNVFFCMTLHNKCTILLRLCFINRFQDFRYEEGSRRVCIAFPGFWWEWKLVSKETVNNQYSNPITVCLYFSMGPFYQETGQIKNVKRAFVKFTGFHLTPQSNFYTVFLFSLIYLVWENKENIFLHDTYTLCRYH